MLWSLGNIHDNNKIVMLRESTGLLMCTVQVWVIAYLCLLPKHHTDSTAELHSHPKPLVQIHAFFTRREMHDSCSYICAYTHFVEENAYLDNGQIFLICSCRSYTLILTHIFFSRPQKFPTLPSRHVFLFPHLLLGLPRNQVTTEKIARKCWEKL